MKSTVICRPRDSNLKTIGTKLHFGTSGIRGVVGRELTPGFFRDVGAAVGTYLHPGSEVCMGNDTRLSRNIVKRAVISGLISSGMHVVDMGILPTPALAFLARELGFDTGIMVTASHNPPEFNGIKLFNGDSQGYSRAQEITIEDIFDRMRFRESQPGTLSEDDSAGNIYWRMLTARFSGQAANQDLKLVIDPGNGAASGFATELFRRIGFQVVPINDVPDGSFPNRSPEPTGDSLAGTVAFLRQNRADLAICFDGDADRVVFCDREGFLGFNEPIAFISRLILEQNGGARRQRVATTVEAGRTVDLALGDLGVEVVRGRVGDANVACLSQEIDAPIGIEEAGVYIVREAGYYPEPFYAALTLLSRVQDISDIRCFFKDIPRLFLRKAKVPCPEELKETLMESMRDASFGFGANEVNTLDGLRFEFDDGWMLIRASGTEPVIRISAESTSRAEAEALVTRGIKAVEKNLRGLMP
jgi:phosphoglucosamine mutase